MYSKDWSCLSIQANRWTDKQTARLRYGDNVWAEGGNTFMKKIAVLLPRQTQFPIRFTSRSSARQHLLTVKILNVCLAVWTRARQSSAQHHGWISLAAGARKNDKPAPGNGGGDEDPEQRFSPWSKADNRRLGIKGRESCPAILPMASAGYCPLGRAVRTAPVNIQSHQIPKDRERFSSWPAPSLRPRRRRPTIALTSAMLSPLLRCPFRKSSFEEWCYRDGISESKQIDRIPATWSQTESAMEV